MSNATASYKQLKEDFVSNLTGGPVSEIAAVTAVLPVKLLPVASVPYLLGLMYFWAKKNRLEPLSGLFSKRVRPSSNRTPRLASSSTIS